MTVKISPQREKFITEVEEFVRLYGTDYFADRRIEYDWLDPECPTAEVTLVLGRDEIRKVTLCLSESGGIGIDIGDAGTLDADGYGLMSFLWNEAEQALSTANDRLAVIERLSETGTAQAFAALSDDDKLRWFVTTGQRDREQTERIKELEAENKRLRAELAGVREIIPQAQKWMKNAVPVLESFAKTIKAQESMGRMQYADFHEHWVQQVSGELQSLSTELSAALSQPAERPGPGLLREQLAEAEKETAAWTPHKRDRRGVALSELSRFELAAFSSAESAEQAVRIIAANALSQPAAEQPAERDVGDDLCWELGDILLGYLDRLNDPTEDDPLEKIVRELRAEASPIVDQILAEGPGRTAEHDAAELVRLFNSNDWPRPGAERESLPLMARREWMQNHTFVAIGPNGEEWGVTEPGMLSGAARVYRIADTDEHGFLVVPRTADMPEGAKYRGWTERTRDWTYYVCFIEKHAHNRFERIEDYNEHAKGGQEGRR